METSPELRQQILSWRESATTLIGAARWGARQRTALLATDEVEGAPDIDAAVERFLGDATALAISFAEHLGARYGTDDDAETGDEELGGLIDHALDGFKSQVDEGAPGASQEELQGLFDSTANQRYDNDAAARALGLVAGSLAVVDALSGAVDEPSTVLAERRLRSVTEYGLDAQGDVELFAGVMLGEIRGGAGILSSTIANEVDRLGDAGGGEVLHLVTTTIVGSGLHSVGQQGLAASRKAARCVLDAVRTNQAFDEITSHLTGLLNSYKRAATRVVHWIVSNIQKLVPARLAKMIVAAYGVLSERFVDPGHIVGRALTGLFGASRLPSNARIDPALIEPYLAHIGWVTAGRTAINRWGGKVVLDLARTFPQVHLGYDIAVATAVVFVAAQVDLGVRTLGRGHHEQELIRQGLEALNPDRSRDRVT